MKHIFIIGLIVLIFGSCDSFLQEYSQDLARVQTVGDFDEILIGDAYYPAVLFRLDGSYLDRSGESLIHCIHFMSDELRQNEKTNRGDWEAFDKFFGYFTWQRQVGIDPQGITVGTEDQDWKQLYKYINVTNMILAELGKVDLKDEQDVENKVRIEGEACFLRALYYFMLVNLYADPYVPDLAAETPGVPLKLTSYVEDKLYARSSVAEVYRQIVDDLENSEKCLIQSKRKSLYRADVGATYLLMSRVYLYMQDYKNARKYAQFVLDRNNALVDLRMYAGKDNILTLQNPEVLFSMGGDYLTYYIYGKDQDKYPDRYPFYVSDDLVEIFEDSDLRKSSYIQEGKNGCYNYKKIYWGRAHYGVSCSVSDNFLFRTSEAYLNLAEAAAFDNDESKAREMLGLLRAKRFVSSRAISESGDALIKLIQEERQRELCLEGHRWFDLRRYSVLEKCKLSKIIYHKYTAYNVDNEPVTVREFELRPGDKGYTLAFPKEVLEFQNSLGVNERPERVPLSEKVNE